MIEGEPRFFDKNVVVLKNVISRVKPSEMADSLTHAPFWLRFYDCPLGGRKEKRIKAMAESLGVPLKIDDNCLTGWTKSIRVKILMDLREPFADEITLEKEKGHDIILQVKYERLPNICYSCGRVGHVERDCEDKDEDGEGGNIYGYGEWMRASPWKTSKEGNRRATENATSARHLVFKPRCSLEEALTPSIEQMAEDLLKVSFQGAFSKGTNETEAEHTTEGSTVREEGRAECQQDVDANVSISATQKQSTWRRLERTRDENLRKDSSSTTSAGKRTADAAEISEMGIAKKSKQEVDPRGDLAPVQAVAAQQPRRAP